MTTTSIGRRARSALALAAGAAVLGLSACGIDGGEPAGSAPETAVEGTAVEGSDSEGASDGGSDSESGRDSEGEDGAGADEGAGKDQDDPGALGERTRIVLATDYEIDETSGDGIPTLEKEKLEALLGDRFEATADCTEGLPLSPGYSVICMGPVGMERPEPTQEWVPDVDCEATTAEGDSWQLKVAPGTYADNDQGLLVGISVHRDGKG